jgi:hypothetical protein
VAFVESSADGPVRRERKSVFVPVCQLQAADGRTHLDVSLAVLPREMNPGDLVERELWLDGFEVVFRHDLAGTNGSDSEMHAARPDGDQERWCRTRVIRDGRRVFRLDWLEPGRTKRVSDEVPRVVFRSFALIAGQRAYCAEDLKQWGHGDGLGFAFSCPAGTAIEIDEHRGGRKAVAVPLGDRRLGTIAVERWTSGSDRSVSTMMREYAAELRGQGLRIHGAPIITNQPPDGFEGSYRFLPESYRDGARLVAGRELLFGPGCEVVLTFSWPAREAHAWAGPVCRSNFEIIRNSVALT